MMSLFLYQFVCMTVFLVMALLLVLMRVFTPSAGARYEQARWVLCGALLLLSVQYILQMRYGFRADSDIAGSTINILFYTPVMAFLGYTHLQLVGGINWRRRFWQVATVVWGSELLAFLGGYAVTGTMAMPLVHAVLMVLFVCGVILLIYMTAREVTRMYRRLESEADAVHGIYYRTLFADSLALILSATLTPFVTMGMPWLLVFGVVAMLAVLVYVAGFISLGFGFRPIADTVASLEQDDAEAAEAKAVAAAEGEPVLLKTELTPERTAEIEAALELWLREHGYRDSSTTLTQLARRTGIGRRELTLYFDRCKQCSFRVWLSMVRLEVAKRLLIEYPDYSNEVVAIESGFSSRSQLYNVFKDYTGKTPKEWKKMCKN